MTSRLNRSPVDIIPAPASMRRGRGRFLIDKDVRIVVDLADQKMSYLGGYLADRISFFTRLDLKVVDTSAFEGNRPAIWLGVERGPFKADSEVYTLLVTPRDISIIGYTRVGVFYGIQSLLQSIHLSDSRISEIHIPAMEIHDYPAYPWRGMHLDVSRHFFPKEFIKKFIDLLAMYKINIFHWHLTDDQGWRIEIKNYPKLTEIGAWRTDQDGIRYGGFYTQDEIREIVEYAGERYVMVFPEIELPGHCRAALAAYPEYSCTGGPFDVPSTWGIFDDVFCPGKEETFNFLKDILNDVISLFPFRYVHIGGDECPHIRWREHDLCQTRIRREGLVGEGGLHNYFITRLVNHLDSLGKKTVGWDEIFRPGLPVNTVVMAWRGIEYGIRAAEAGHYVIMTPTSYCYFDYYQAKEGEPKAIGGYLPLEKVYKFNPTPKTISPEAAARIIGGQGNIWTEYMPHSDIVEYMALPRMCAMAEALWSPVESRNIDDFKKRLKSHYPRFDQIEFWYRPHGQEPA